MYFCVTGFQALSSNYYFYSGCRILSKRGNWLYRYYTSVQQCERMLSVLSADLLAVQRPKSVDVLSSNRPSLVSSGKTVQLTLLLPPKVPWTNCTWSRVNPSLVQRDVEWLLELEMKICSPYLHDVMAAIQQCTECPNSYKASARTADLS